MLIWADIIAFGIYSNMEDFSFVIDVKEKSVFDKEDSLFLDAVLIAMFLSAIAYELNIIKLMRYIFKL